MTIHYGWLIAAALTTYFLWLMWMADHAYEEPDE